MRSSSNGLFVARGGAAWLLTAAILGGGCVLDDVSPGGKPCPCPAAFRCDPAQNLCVEIAATASSGSGGTGTGSGSTSSGAVACNGTCGTPGCSACPTVAMIDGGLGYTIDATEVPRGDYVRFLADAVDPATQGPECAWNTLFAPDPAVDETCVGYAVDTQPVMPITCVDWCDAYAFCKWAGKRLCGKIGGGPLPRSGINDGALSQWYAACSASGTQQFPYGNTYTPDLCLEGGAVSEVFVTANTECDGSFPGLLNMVGNVEEWEDACDLSATPTDDECELRGGAFWASHDEAGKDWAQCPGLGRSADRARASHDWGFRCCDDP